MTKRRLVALLVVLLLLAGCASTGGQTDSAKTTAWKVLMTNKTVYDKTFTALSMLDKQGKLPAQVKVDAIKYGNIYVDLHNAAVKDLEAGKIPSTGPITVALNQFVALAAPYLEGK